MKRTERGWPGHFIAASRCLFRRNTLIEHENVRIVVSTVGMYAPSNVNEIEPIAFSRWHETAAFKATKQGPYWDADVSAQVPFNSQWGIYASTFEDLPNDADNQADEMHERIVAEIMDKLQKGVDL